MRALVAILMLGATPLPLMATERGLDTSHRALKATLGQLGVTVRTLPQGAPGTCSEAMGNYAPRRKEIVVCLWRGRYDLESKNTLRHEAIHVLQDCKGGGLGNGALLLGSSFGISSAIARSHGFNLTKDMRPYMAKGLSRLEIWIEAEAIAKATVMTADRINRKLKRACRR